MSLAETLVRSTAGRKRLSDSSGLVGDRFHQQPHVVSVRVGDTTVLMDRKRGTYFTLNEVGGQVWDQVGAGARESEIVEWLLEEYEVSRDQLEADVAATLRQLASNRLIASGVMSVAPPALKQESKRQIVPVSRLGEPRVPSMLRCGLVIVAVKAMLKTLGLDWTINWANRRVEKVPVRSEVDLMAVKATEHRVAIAGALYPGRALCLEQSLALWYVLRCMGMPAAFRVGVQAHPFQAHAWVEVSGEIVNDIAERVNQFQAFESLLP